MNHYNPARMEFHVSRRARDFYQFDKSLFSFNGNVIFADFHSSRVFAQKMNQKKDLLFFPEKAIKAGQLNAMGLIDEILHLVIGLYREQKAPNVMHDAIKWLNTKLDKSNIDSALYKFADEFPPIAVYRREISLDDYMEGETAGYPNRQIILEEMLMLWLANVNPAFSPFMELFDDSNLKKDTNYVKMTSLMHDFFETQPHFGPDNQNLIDMLRSPAIIVPHSLPGQLEYIRQRWGFLLHKYLYRLLTALDLIKEEEKPIFGVGGQGPSRVYEFRGLESEPERFSPDKDWMPRLVLIAKNAYVWLDQLSKKYNRSISTLADIPDEELEILASWGFTGLWLIGLWERSQASKNIKIMRGNPEAVASAYSLQDYSIAIDLGGDTAYQNLSDRAWAHGIRLASDMVPNHMGIDSKWVIEHPDWFVGLKYSPFPSYSFNGSNFSPDSRFGVYVEDHYFNNTDAAVVFKRVDFWSGDTRYIYHGNDGTSMPWNDTAQLNFLNPEVREGVIQTILHVARKFPIIRFDAAMTLAKKHYQRLWFPEPGTGGAIPSRAEFGLTKEQFDAAFPEEFWRQVVDRVAQELPDTLLLAEAFWLMEGYFVRTLGMHRVYNSAFMNMLRDEKNAEYRLVIKNTIEFDPEILRRYVNFMNNPDEHTAIDQFGNGDKYFGICTLMATMPGLPMFGHGQVEGFTEKYGMEYRRAYWDEKPDQWLVDRHIRDIFPLLRKRRLFAEVKDFLLYDFYTSGGYVNEDVFAYSNRLGDECSLVIYHNKYASTSGWIKTSAAYSFKTETGEKKRLQKSLAEGLGLIKNENYFTIYRDHISNLEYIRSNHEILAKGLYIELEAYKCQVLLDFRQEQDNEWHQFRTLVEYLQGRGVPSINEAIKEIFLQPIHGAYRNLINKGFFDWVISHRLNIKTVEHSDISALMNESKGKIIYLLEEIKKFTMGNGNEEDLSFKNCKKMEAVLNLPILDKQTKLPDSSQLQAAVEFIQKPSLFPELQEMGDALVEGKLQIWGVLLAWLFNHELGRIISEEDFSEISLSWVDEWMLGKIIVGTLQDLGLDEDSAWQSNGLVKLLIKHSRWWKNENSFKKKENGLETEKNNHTYNVMQTWLVDSDVQQFLGVNRYQDILWFNKESLEKWLWWMFVTAVVEILSRVNKKLQDSPESIAKEIISSFSIIHHLLKVEESSGYQVEKLLNTLKMIV